MDDLLLTSSQYGRLLDGVQLTLHVLAQAFVLGVALSLVVGVARLSRRRWVRGIALVYVEASRGISTLVLLFWMAFALPILLGVSQPSLLLMGSIALGLNMGGYGAEIVRGSIQSVPQGQTEACIALNLTNTQRLRHVVIPQAMQVILPPMGNLTIEILKGTALVSLIGLSDLTFEINKLRVSQRLAEDPTSVAVLFLHALVIYFLLAQVINALFRFGEARLARGLRSRAVATPAPVPEATTDVGVRT